MQNLEITKGKNIIVDKPYLQRFYTSEKPKWILFIEQLLDDKFTVMLYLPKNTNSVYLTLVKNNKMLKIRYSNHAPNIEAYLKGGVKFCIGPTKKGMLSERWVMNAVKLYFRK